MSIGLISQRRRLRSKVYDYRNFDISSATLISQSGTHAAGYWPDGTIIALKNHDNDDFAIYMSNRFAIKATGSTPYPEDKMGQLVTANRVFGEGITPPISGFTDDGVWFIGMHRTGGNNLIGFFHSESGYPGPQFEAYRNIGVTYSTDNGLTWSTPEKIIAPTYTKPTEIIHSGVGDGCVIYDPVAERFLCYYMAHETYKLCMAASDTGASGTWYKWDGTDFTIEAYNSSTGVGGPDGNIPGLDSVNGRNPQVMWNETLSRWVMVIGGWDGSVYMSSSEDGITWEEAFRAIGPQGGDAVYPSLVSPEGSSVGNTAMKLYHGRNTDPITVAREFVYRELELTPAESYILPTPITDPEYIINTGDSLLVEPSNLPDYLVEAEWRVGSESGFVTSRDIILDVPPEFTTSPTSISIYVRFKHHGYSSPWHNFTVTIVEPD